MLAYYRILGVSERATQQEIRAAFTARAKLVHPDAHAGVGEAETASYQRLMAAVNEAYHVLSDEQRRREYDGTRSGEARATGDHSRRRPPRDDECTLCGSAPARQLRFGRQTGWVLGRTTYSSESILCRDCGLALGRDAQNRTLILGWWGIIAAFTNLFLVGGNAVSLRQAAGLGPPVLPSEPVDVVLPHSLPTGPSVWRRAGGLLGMVLAVVVAVTVVAVASAESPSSTRGSVYEPVRDDPVGWRVGSCVEGSTRVEPVPCDEPNDGRIVDRVSDPSDCPYSADSYVEDGLDTWCIS